MIFPHNGRKKMKNLFENWRKYLNEQSAPQMTYGQLADGIKIAQELKKGRTDKERIKQLSKQFGKIATNFALSFAGPLGGLIQIGKDSAETVADIAKTYIGAPDQQTRDNTVLSLFNLDDSFEDLVDDRLENKFEVWVTRKIKELADDPSKRDQPIADMDTVLQRWLSNPQLSGLPDANRTVTKP